MSHDRSNSSPELLHPFINLEQPDDSTLQGVAANVKLLLKIIQDHSKASTKDSESRKMLRVAGMLTVLDTVKARIQKSQSFGKKREAELRRCNTDLRDEKQRLERELNASLAARRSLERMFSSLGKEKKIMATELERKIQELNGMEEELNDLKAHNAILLGKVQVCATKHKNKISVGEDNHRNVILQEGNKALSEQILMSIEGYRSLKRKLKEIKEENAVLHTKMVEETSMSLDIIHNFLQKMDERSEQPLKIEEELPALEHMFQCFQINISNTDPKLSA